KIKYEGTVLSKSTGLPIKGLSVILWCCIDRSAKDWCDMRGLADGVTDDTGHFVIESKAARSNRYTVQVKGCLWHNDGFIAGSYPRVSEDELKRDYSIIYCD